mgnify:CR=1 FL=1
MLALDGGRPVWSGPQPQWPTFARGTARRLAEILESGRVNAWTGGYNHAFEERFAARIGAKHAFAVANGTLALTMAFAALGIGSGDEVIVPPYTFISSASAAAILGATPVFCDVGEDHLIDPAKIGALVTPRTKAIVVVHLYGAVAKMDRLRAVARRHGLAIVEDCAQALGATFRARAVGTLGDIGCFSFCQTKHFTTGGEGGMVVTSSARLAERLASLREHGCDMRARLAPQKAGEIRPVTYPRLGFSARMTELQAAIGLGELGLGRGQLNSRGRRLLEELLLENRIGALLVLRDHLLDVRLLRLNGRRGDELGLGLELHDLLRLLGIALDLFEELVQRLGSGLDRVDSMLGIDLWRRALRLRRGGLPAMPHVPLRLLPLGGVVRVLSGLVL